VNFLQSSDHVIANAASVSNWRVFADLDAAVDAMTQMLGELAIDIWVHHRTWLVTMDRQSDGTFGKQA